MKRDIEFRSGGETVRGWLITPDSGDAPYPVIVMAGGWCYVKELVMPNYAEYFTREGFATIIFDYRHLGASTGEPRQHVDPNRQIEDYRNAITFAENHADLDPNRIGIWGISYSGGHVLIVAAQDPRVRAVVSVVPVVDGWANMRRSHGTIGFRRLLETVLADRRNRFKTGQHGYIGMSGDPTTEVLTWPYPETKPIFLNLQATTSPAHEHRNTIESVELLLNYSVFPFAPRILKTPTLMLIADEDDLTPWDLALEVFDKILCTTKKAIIMPKASHMQIYDDMSKLAIAGNAGARWFKEHLWEPDAWVLQYRDRK